MELLGAFTTGKPATGSGVYLSYDVPAEMTWNRVLKHTFFAFFCIAKIFGVLRGCFDSTSMDVPLSQLPPNSTINSSKSLAVSAVSFAALGVDVQPP